MIPPLFIKKFQSLTAFASGLRGRKCVDCPGNKYRISGGYVEGDCSEGLKYKVSCTLVKGEGV